MQPEKNQGFLDSIYDTEEYRDSIATVDEKGKRIWIYPKRQEGLFLFAENLHKLGLIDHSIWYAMGSGQR